MCNNCKWEVLKSANGELIGFYNSREEAQIAAMNSVRIPFESATGRWISTTAFVVEYGETPKTATFHILYRTKRIMG